MKNIHLISTDKPTGIWKSGNNLHFSIMNKVRTDGTGFHLYITSSEKPKVGEWILYGGKSILKLSQIHPKAVRIYGEPIILTDNKDLIQDGVQAIDGTFIEWVFKNPSCEWVEVDLVPVNEFGSEVTVNSYGFEKFVYKIIIPNQESKQETLEEAAKKHSEQFDYAEDSCPEEAFILGAKWMQERMYRGKEVRNIGEEEHTREMILMNANTIIDTRTKPNLKNTVTLEDIKQVVQNTLFPDNLETTQKRMYSEEEAYKMTLEALDLGMQIRQDQLNGYSEKSGKELHKEWFEKFKK